MLFPHPVVSQGLERFPRTEYGTIISIMICMTVWDFVIGVLFGIVASCELPHSRFCNLTYSEVARLLFRCPKFATEKYTGITYGGNSHVDGPQAQCTARILA